MNDAKARKRRKTAKDAYEKKVKYEGLFKIDQKKEYYDILNEYSKREGFSKPTCFCCKMNDWKFLVFDHRRKRPDSHKGKSGIGMARKLKKQGYPKSIQILCHNCNTGKEIYGTKHCPHHLSKKGKKRLKSIGLPLK